MVGIAMTPLIQSMVRAFAKAGRDPTEFHWFDATECIAGTKEVPRYPLTGMRSPFEKCMLCVEKVTDNYGRLLMGISVTGADPEKGITLALWRLLNNDEPSVIRTIEYLVTNGDQWHRVMDENGAPIDEKFIRYTLDFLWTWLDAMSRRAEAYVPVEKSAAVNRRRAKHGKAPIYEWRTVLIEPVQPKQASQGGAHASPRLHDRRGHLRHLRSGKNVWVRPCKVGDASKGVVFHDYKVVAA